MPVTTTQQLANAIMEHKYLVARAEDSAKTYQRYHDEQHKTTKQLLHLTAASNPFSLTAVVRANVGRGIRDMQSYWSICMTGERGRWSGILGEIKVVREKIAKLEKLVAEEEKKVAEEKRAAERIKVAEENKVARERWEKLMATPVTPMTEEKKAVKEMWIQMDTL